MQKQRQHSELGAVVVTGGGSGIGRAIAEQFAHAGEAVIIFDYNKAAAEQVASDLTVAGYRAAAFAGSVSDEADVSAAFDLADSYFNGVKTLINNAGVSGNCPTIELSLAEWQRNIDVNLTGVFLCAREAGRRLIKANRPGKIITLPNPVFATYLVSCHARGIRSKRQVDQLEHRLQIVAWIFRRDVEIEVVNIDRWKWRINPAFGFLDLDLRFADRFKIFIQAFLVM